MEYARTASRTKDVIGGSDNGVGNSQQACYS
jgi:hypothetical protein